MTTEETPPPAHKSGRSSLALALPLRAECVYTDDEGNGYGGIFDANGHEIASATMWVTAKTLAKAANAAPDLLRELDSLVQLCEVWMARGTLDRHSSVLDPARLALSRARGDAS